MVYPDALLTVTFYLYALTTPQLPTSRALTEMRIRNRSGADSSDYKWPDMSAPPGLSRNPSTSIYADFLPDPPKALPDVPLNVDHRYCTPPPLDPRMIDEPIDQKDDFPPYLGRAPSPDDFDELTGAREPLPARPGTIGNPYVIEDDDDARRCREARQQSSAGEDDSRNGSSSKRATRKAAKTNSSGSASGSASPSSSRRSRYNTRASAPEPPEPMSRAELYKKTAADGFSPMKPSPLKNVAYKAPSPHTTQVSDRWYIPPRKHSTGSVTVSSVTSSDSEYDE
ncbi:hypothetical protein C8Q79DRAFT_948012 [Trametes meyenii]|nr:hypothetical protein C8Q79DRAFT_948012 [Trametes meyenii]